MIRNCADHSANERTFLAWVRTSVAVVGFGLTVARLSDRAPPLRSEALVLCAGALVVALAFMRMRSLRRRIDAAEALDDAALPAESLPLLLLAAFFALLGSFAIHVS